MKETLEKLWDEYFAEICSGIDTEAERALIKKVSEMNKKTKELLTSEQSDVMEAYIEAVYQMQGSFVKKAFFKGCEFAMSFFFEAWNFKNT